MIGALPKEFEIGGIKYNIETDYRNVLVIISAMNDPELSLEDKLYIMLRRIYGGNLDKIPREYMQEALEKTRWFLDCGKPSGDDKKVHRQFVDWEQDEALLFPAINKVAGMEIRSAEYIHWWTFVGYYMEIGEGAFSTVLSIRQKKAKNKKLEKWEREFYQNNKSVCDLKKKYTKEEQAEIDYWNQLLG